MQRYVSTVENRGARLPLTTAIAVVAVAILALTFALPPTHPIRPTAARVGASIEPIRTSASGQLSAASASLRTGAGPAGGHPATCTGTSGSLSCHWNAGSPVSAASRPSAAPPSGWQPVATVTPPNMFEASAVYDAKDGYTVLFGGVTVSAANGFWGTWTYSGGSWTNITAVASHPPGRYFASMAYDGVDKYVVLFGGTSGSATLSDTWKFTGGTWTKLAPATHPSARFSAGMAFDSTDGVVVLFGGATHTLSTLSDTWTFVGTTWTKLTLTTSPSSRAFVSMANDPGRSGAVLFGGWSGGNSLADTWIFHNKTWTAGPTTGGPPGRYGGALSYDAPNSEVVLFGGFNTTTGQAMSDTWTFTAANWTKIGPAFHPSSRSYPAVSDGTATSGPFVFGGYSPYGNVALNDTWTFKSGVWKKDAPPAPAARSVGGMTYDEADGYVLLFGGAVQTKYDTHDTWTFSAGHWKLLHPKLSPSSRDAPAMAYDQADGYVVLFGGEGPTGTLGDTWTYLAGVWTPVSTPVAPSPRILSAITYDAADGYVVLFGGENSTFSPQSDTWTFSAGAWSPGVASVAPPARGYASMTYDSEDGYVLMFGGLTATNGEYNDTWSYLAGTWTNLSSTVTFAPPSALGAGLADDTYDGFPVLWGGANNTLGFLIAAYAWTGSTWTSLATGFSFPSGRVPGEQFVYDAADSSIVMYGGEGPFLASFGDTWTLN
jgi:hypothetical protein